MGETENIAMPGLLVLGIIGMLLLAIAIVIFFVIYQKRLLRQQESILQLESEYQMELLNSSIQIQEVERKRIASDLHDSIGSMLSATKLYLKQLQPQQVESEIQLIKKESLSLIEEIILNIREITHNLAPQSLERFGLISAIEDLVSKINDLNIVVVSFEFNDNRRFSSDQETALYRIIQELLNNSLKHAQARQIHIETFFLGDQLRINYMDDGIGFKMTQLKDYANKGFGLRGIENRINLLHATFDIQTEEGKGVQIQIGLTLYQ